MNAFVPIVLLCLDTCSQFNGDVEMNSLRASVALPLPKYHLPGAKSGA